MYSPTSVVFLFFWILTILILCTTTLTAAAASISSNSSSSNKPDSDEKGEEDQEETNDDGFRHLVALVKEHGGRVADASFQIQQMNDRIRGVVATTDITNGTELLFCPWELVLGSTSRQKDHQMPLTDDDMCSVVESIDEELHLREKSLWYWYLKFHHDDIIKMPRLSSFWSPAALEQLQGIPPQNEGNRHVRRVTQECEQQLYLSKYMKEALTLYLTRSTTVGLAPIYDLFNHHTGLRNAKLELKRNGVHLFAMQDIPAGSQIYISYGLKMASSIFRDYGFVESWPQIWTWTDTHDHTLLMLDNVPVIYPTQEFLQEFLHRKTIPPSVDERSSLSSFQQVGMQHNSRYLGRQVLVLFETSAAKLLDSMPTTLQEDVKILVGMKQRVQQLMEEQEQSNQGKVNGNSNAERRSPKQIAAMILSQSDSISAVEYRIKFKQAAHAGLNTARRILSSQSGQQQTSSRVVDSEL